MIYIKYYTKGKEGDKTKRFIVFGTEWVSNFCAYHHLSILEIHRSNHMIYIKYYTKGKEGDKTKRFIVFAQSKLSQDRSCLMVSMVMDQGQHSDYLVGICGASIARVEVAVLLLIE